LREATPSVLSSHLRVGRSVRCGRQAPPGRPRHVRQRARLLYCQAAPRLVQGGRGEVFAVAGVAATRPWRGPGGYIQVGMRGCESGSGIIPHSLRAPSSGRKNEILFAIQTPSYGGEIARSSAALRLWRRLAGTTTTTGGPALLTSSSSSSPPACCPACLLACVSDGGGLCAALVCVCARCLLCPGDQQQPASDQRVVWWRCLPAARPPGAVTLTELETWVVVEPRGG